MKSCLVFRIRETGFIIFFLMSSLFAVAQKTVSGKVLSADNQQPVAGATITLKGTQKTVLSDRYGNYTIEASGGDILVFSNVGYQPQELKSDEAAVVMLSIDSKNLSEVVVTALGIKRGEKSLGYAATNINENAVKDARATNWANSLNGKVAGLNIQGTGSGPISSSRITLRGESSLNLENNQALIVVDGIPVSSRITGTGYKAHLAADNPVDFGSTVSDINPDDIQSISVLKGAGATALYGSRAAGGAIIITTKSGTRKEKGIGVTYNLNISFDQVNRWPDYQFEYGEGRTDLYYSYGDSPDGINTSTNVAAGRAWGPRFNGQNYFQYDPNSPTGQSATRVPWVAHSDYISGFFKTGTTVSNSVSLEGGGEKGSARLSFTHLKNDWILPNTGFQRINTSLSFNQQISPRLKLNGKINYTNKTSDNLPAAGYNNQTIMYFLIIGTAPNIRPEWFKPYWKPGLEGVSQKNPFNTGPDNPYLDLYEMLNKLRRHGVVGNLSATYEFSPKLELMIRSGMDMSFEFRSQQRPFSMTKYPRGMYREQDVFSGEINSDALLTYKDQLSPSIRYSVSAGANAMRQTYDFAGIYADQLSQPGVYQLSNSLDPAVSDPLRTKKAINSVYGLAQLSYKERVFIDLTGRNDWSSTLPYGNNSFFYPSATTSLLWNEIVKLPAFISFAKTRFAWAQVGNDTRPYQTDKYYDRIFGNSFTNPSVLFNAKLKPEITSSVEAGIDLRFFKNRIGVDAAVYNNNSRNQILAIPLDPVSGYSSSLINAGLINSRGVEVQLNLKPVIGKNFRWNSTITWSQNRSYVRELADGITNQILYSHDGNVNIEARVGGRMGDLYGRGFQRSPDGQIIYNSVGLPATLDPVTKKWGNAFADWKAGLLNEFVFKNFRVSVLFDGQKGGDMYSQTNHKNNTLGKTKVTLPGRAEGGLVGDGVVLNTTTGKYERNTTKVNYVSYYETYYAINNAETNIFDASFIKLRELRFEYSLPKQVIQKLHLSQATVALVGRELFNFTKFPGFDPEGGNLNSGTLTPGVELTQFPSTRSMGINLTIKF